MQQLHHANTQNNERKFPITLVCDAIRTPQNIGMIFRIAESFGVSKIYFHESSPSVDNKTVKKVARSTIREVKSETYSDFKALIGQLKKENTIIGIELTDESINLPDFNFTQYQNIVLVLGSERHGIAETSILDHCVQIEMYGKNSSMNVANSLAITLYEVTQQILNLRS
ncbi:MAG: rRNA methyltransferase [Flavobacteriales bacterium]|nr:MAG: rRNA methyltransferase [Flavobacteriales bacterium]